MSANPQYKNVFHGTYVIVKKHGFGGIYKGYLATLLKQSSNQGVRFVVFEDTQKFLQQYIKVKMLCDFLSGGFAGFCSTMFNNPVDVVKTQMQGLDAHKYKGFGDCFMTILRNEGLRGFYKGITPRLARVILDVAITFTVFNQLKRMLVKLLA